MTWAQLGVLISEMSDIQKYQDVTVRNFFFDEELTEFEAICDMSEVKEGTYESDLLDVGHKYLVPYNIIIKT